MRAIYLVSPKSHACHILLPGCCTRCVSTSMALNPPLCLHLPADGVRHTRVPRSASAAGKQRAAAHVCAARMRCKGGARASLPGTWHKLDLTCASVQNVAVCTLCELATHPRIRNYTVVLSAACVLPNAYIITPTPPVQWWLNCESSSWIACAGIRNAKGFVVSQHEMPHVHLQPQYLRPTSWFELGDCRPGLESPN